MVFFACFLMAVIVLICGLIFQRDKLWVKILATILLVQVLFVTFIISSLMFSMEGGTVAWSGLLVVADFALHLVVFLLGIFLIFKLYKDKIVKRCMIVLMVFCIIFASYIFISWNYDMNMPRIVERETKQNEIVKLDKESSFKLTNNLPKLDGATALYPVYVAFANAVYPDYVTKELFINHYQTNTDYVRCTTTKGAYNAIVDGSADIIFVASPSTEQEEKAKELGIELVYTPIGKDGFVFFVNSKNPVNNLTIDEIKGVYSGEITTWKTIGEMENLKNDSFALMTLGKIKAFQRDKGSGSQTNLEKIMGDTKIKEPILEERQDFMSGMVSAVASQYKNYKNAIGYSFRYYVEDMVDNTGIKFLSINNVYPSKENIANDTYPFAGSFYAVTRRDCSSEIKQFVEWMKSSEGQELVEKVGYVKTKED